MASLFNRFLAELVPSGSLDTLKRTDRFLTELTLSEALDGKKSGVTDFSLHSK